jgi:putative oxidoreductase
MRGREATALAIGLLILRLGMGGYLLTHGVSKLRMLLGGQFAMFGDPIGIGPVASLLLVTIAEFLGALLVIAGLGTRPAAAIVVISMAVAAFVAHGADPFTMEKGYILYTSGAAKTWFSKQPALMFLIPFLALVFTGAGELSIDAWIRRRRWAGKAAVPGGTPAAP